MKTCQPTASILTALCLILLFHAPAHADGLDANGDGVFDSKDLPLLAELLTNNDPNADINGDGKIDFSDLFQVSGGFGDPVPTPTPVVTPTATPAATATPTPTAQATATPTPTSQATATPSPEPTATPTSAGGDPNIRDYYPYAIVGDFVEMLGVENIGAIADDFRREVVGFKQVNGMDGIEFFTITRTNTPDELQEFYDTLTLTGDLAILQLRLDEPLELDDTTIPAQSVNFSSPLVIAPETVTVGWTSSTSSPVTVQTGFGPASGTVTTDAEVLSIGDSVAVDVPGMGEVVFTDTITIEYQSNVQAQISFFTIDEFLPPLSAVVTLARGVGIVRLQEFVDQNSIGEIFEIQDGRVNGVDVP